MRDAASAGVTAHIQASKAARTEIVFLKSDNAQTFLRASWRYDKPLSRIRELCAT